MLSFLGRNMPLNAFFPLTLNLARNEIVSNMTKITASGSFCKTRNAGVFQIYNYHSFLI